MPSLRHTLAALMVVAGCNATASQQLQDSAAIREALIGNGTQSRGIAARPRLISLQIQFQRDSAVLGADAGRQLDELWLALGDPQLRTRSIEISGHTDASGDAEYNRQLSERRAEAVRKYVAAKGPPVDVSLLSVVGHGESQLLTGLLPEDPAHRRVEIRVL